MPFCSNCQKPLQSALWCGACQQLQSSGLQADDFSVFGLPPRYDVDLNSLEQSYHELAAELHPDFFATAPAAERRLSEGLSARLNQAWQTLQDPTARAQYLIEVWKAKTPTHERDLPTGFLQEMFALQEELEELLEAKDQQALATKRADFLQRLNDLRYNYQQQLIKLKENTPDTTFCKQIQQQLNAERYLLRLLERCSSTSSETDL